jgi:hypothetical protein
MADTKTSVVIQARVDGLASVKGLEGGLTKLGNTADKTGGKFAKFNGLLRGLGGAIAAAGLTRILGNAAEVAAGFESETLLLKQGLENVGAATGELERLQGVADELGKATLFNEEDFRQGFGLLTSFGNIATENYDRVAMAAANVAQVSGTDVSSSFMQLAKALNDPVKGLTALSRSGIQFTEDQKAMIESMVEAGNTAKAQEMILKELDAQYGNTAVAAAGGAAGVKDTFGEAMYDLNVAVGRVVNEVLPPFLAALTEIINAFTGMPQPVQAAVIAIGGIAALATLLAPVVSTIGSLIGLLTGGGGLAAAIAAVFTGPVGWIALLVAAGVAIYAFRDQIGAALKAISDFFVDAFKFIGDLLKQAAQAYLDFYVKPILRFARSAFDGIVNIFGRIAEAVRGPFNAASNVIKSIFRNILTFLVNSLNTWISRVNFAISIANRLPRVNIPQVPSVSVPEFAQGGVVGGPTLAMVGEGGEREYIVHESKMARASANYLAGMRGRAVIPAFAEGGVVGPGGGGGAANTTVQITTGPVLQQDGQRYVTVGDLERALQDFGSQIFRNSRTYGGRRYQGAF